MCGRFGVCLFGDPSYAGPQGVATGTPVCNGAQGAASQVLNTKGWTHSVTGILKAGDILQIGSGLTQRIYYVCRDVNSDSSGDASVQIYPCLRDSGVTDGQAITLSNPQGCFRLLNNRREWSVDNAMLYGVAFSLVEAL
jgi:hypothetical protein